jgi:soluble P-type ATPase
MEEESWYTTTVKYMKGSGEMIRKMVKELRNFPMELFIAGNTSSENLMDKDDISGKEVSNTKANGETDKDMVVELGMEQKEIFIKANGGSGNLKVLALTHLQIATFMRDNLNNHFAMDREFRNSPMEICIEVTI